MNEIMMAVLLRLPGANRAADLYVQLRIITIGILGYDVNKKSI